MKMQPTDYEMKLLRHLVTGEPDPDLAWGAAMSVSISYLRGMGLVKGYTKIEATDKGRELISEKEGEDG